ncbi:MAG: CPBP family intramembrane glutamic endopeptidase, partial [Pirellulaceae bacterium]
ITSFAKSFKEAQAYLIPLMLLALTPGVMSLMPGIKFTATLATVPLVNIVLLAREVLAGSAEWNTALVAILCNTIYALAALVLASRLFGTDASMHGSKGSWSDLLLRPRETQLRPTADQMALTMAIMFPLYFIASSSLSGLPEWFGFDSDLTTKLWFSAGVSVALILCVPLMAAWYRNIQFKSTFLLSMPAAHAWLGLLPAVVLLGGSAWMFAHEIFIFAQNFIGTINFELFADYQERLKSVPLVVVLIAFALTPAVCEEVLFRGFVLSSLHRFSQSWAVVLSAVLFGLMHVLTSNVLAVERFLPTTFMGLILGFVAVRTRSLWPGMLLHSIHNGLLLSMGHYEDELARRGILVDEGEHLPAVWLITGAIVFVVGIILILRSPPIDQPEEYPVSTHLSHGST